MYRISFHILNPDTTRCFNYEYISSVFPTNYYRNQTVVFSRFVNFLVYYSLNYMVTMLSGDRYLNFFLYGVVELPAYVITWYSLYRYNIYTMLQIPCMILPNYELPIVFMYWY